MKKHLLQSLLAVALLLVCGNVWAQVAIFYTLTPASGTNNSYAGNCDVEIGGITWNLTGNSTMQPWRLGGKSISNQDRAIYSKTALGPNVTKIEVTHGESSGSITVNSMTLNVYSTADLAAAGGNGDVSSLTGTYEANTTVTFTRPEGVSWAGRYYSIIYNLSVVGSSNKYISVALVNFYKASSQTYTVSVATDLEGGTISATPNSCVEQGTEVTLANTPKDNYTFGSYVVKDSSGEDVAVQDGKFAMPSSDVTVSAIFNRKTYYAINLVTSEFGTISATVNNEEVSEIYEGAEVKITASSTNSDYAFKSWAITGATIDEVSKNPTSFIMGTQPVTVEAIYERAHTYSLVTTIDDLSVGDKVIIVAYDYDFAMSTTQNNNNRAAAAITKSGSKCTVNEYVQEFTLEAGTQDGTFAFNAGNGYIYAASSSSNYLKTSEGKSDDSSWNISISSDGKATITAQGTNSRNTLKYNPNGDNHIFSCYSSGQKDVAIYKFNEIKSQDITISSVGWATACVPFTATVSGATAYTAKVEDGALVKTPITVIPAGTGVLLESVNGGATTATFTESGLEGDDVNGNQLCGNATNASVTWGNEEGATAIFTYYIFANDAEDGLGFYWQKGTGGNSVSCGAYKAALVVPGTPATESGAIGYRIGGTTMVEQMLNDSKSAEIYDILGRKVENATKGLYIINGKKVLVK